MPIILWMIISYAFLSIHLPDSLSAKIQIAFLLFGIFSSTALSKILVSKFNTFRKEDFIVALKLLGISDFRIIFVILLIQYYCLPLIIMQTIYIFAQCFFMDITLTVLNYGDKNTLGALFLEFLSVINKDSTFHFVVILSLFIYVILSSFFYLSQYLKEVYINELSLLKIDNMSSILSSKDGPVFVLNDISLKIKQGQTVGLVGESGSGKTQLSMAFCGMQDLTPGVVSGQIKIKQDQDIINIYPNKSKRFK